MNNQKNNKIPRLARLIYTKLIRINDSPHKVAMGFGLGVFFGILPGTGPLASLFFAAILRVNRASALLGNLITNTWLSLLTLALSMKIGAFFIGSDWQRVHRDWSLFLLDFHWRNLFRLSLLKMILPVAIGYLTLGFIFGLICYLIIYLIYNRKPKSAAKFIP